MKGTPRLFRALACLAALSFAVDTRAASDFAPLAVGNRWIYSGTDEGGGFWWNYTLRHSVRRTLTVDSSREVPGGREWFLSYRDLLFDRIKSGGPDLEDTVVGGISLHKLLRDTCAYARGVGLTSLERSYNVWNMVRYTQPYRSTHFRLIDFKGTSTVGVSTPSHKPGPLAGDFLPMKVGTSWKWRALRHRVLNTNRPRPQFQDSLIRNVRVASAKRDAAGVLLCRMDLRDSLFAHNHDNTTRNDTVEIAEFAAPCEARPRIGATAASNTSVASKKKAIKPIFAAFSIATSTRNPCLRIWSCQAAA